MVHNILKKIVCLPLCIFFLMSESYSMRPLACTLARASGSLARTLSAPAACRVTRQVLGTNVLARQLSGPATVEQRKSLEADIEEQEAEQKREQAVHDTKRDTKQEDTRSSTIKKGFGATLGMMFAGVSLVWAGTEYREHELQQIAFDCIVALEHGKIQDDGEDIIINDSKKKTVIGRAKFFEAIARYIMSDSVCTNNLSLAFAQYIKVRGRMPSKTLLFLLLTYGSHQVIIINALVRSLQIRDFPSKEFTNFYEENFEKPRVETCEGTIRSEHDRTIADQLIVQAGLLENAFTQGTEVFMWGTYRDLSGSQRLIVSRNMIKLTKFFADKKNEHTIKFRYTREDFKTMQEKYDAERRARRAVSAASV